MTPTAMALYSSAMTTDTSGICPHSADVTAAAPVNSKAPMLDIIQPKRGRCVLTMRKPKPSRGTGEAPDAHISGVLHWATAITVPVII